MAPLKHRRRRMMGQAPGYHEPNPVVTICRCGARFIDTASLICLDCRLLETRCRRYDMAPAYDYKAQRWVTDPEAARRLHIEHLEQDITLLSSSKAQYYLSSIGRRETPAEALAMANAKLASHR